MGTGGRKFTNKFSGPKGQQKMRCPRMLCGHKALQIRKLSGREDRDAVAGHCKEFHANPVPYGVEYATRWSWGYLDIPPLVLTTVKRREAQVALTLAAFKQARRGASPEVDARALRKVKGTGQRPDAPGLLLKGKDAFVDLNRRSGAAREIGEQTGGGRGGRESELSPKWQRQIRRTYGKMSDALGGVAYALWISLLNKRGEGNWEGGGIRACSQ